jgi:hypothetical protein
MGRGNSNWTSRKDDSVAADMVKGAIAGAVGVWVMDQVGWGMYLRENREALRQEQEARVEGKDVAHVAAGKLAGAVGRTLSPEQPHPAGIAVHYALGMIPGALYGVLRNRIDRLGTGRGLVYGLGLFLVNDEILAPVLGLASGPLAYPWQAHVRGLVAHVVLGAATDTIFDVLDQVT